LQSYNFFPDKVCVYQHCNVGQTGKLFEVLIDSAHLKNPACAPMLDKIKISFTVCI